MKDVIEQYEMIIYRQLNDFLKNKNLKPNLYQKMLMSWYIILPVLSLVYFTYSLSVDFTFHSAIDAIILILLFNLLCLLILVCMFSYEDERLIKNKIVRTEDEILNDLYFRKKILEENPNEEKMERLNKMIEFFSENRNEPLYGLNKLQGYVKDEILLSNLKEENEKNNFFKSIKFKLKK